MKKKKIFAIVLSLALVVQFMSAEIFTTFATEIETHTNEVKTITEITDDFDDIAIFVGSPKPVLDDTLDVKVGETTEQVAITWTLPADTEFSSATVADFTYTATLPSAGYALADGVTMPKVVVSVVELTPVPSYAVGGAVKTLDAIYANGVPIQIESAGGNLTQIRYDSDKSGTIDTNDELLNLKHPNDTEKVTSADMSNVTIYGGGLKAGYGDDQLDGALTETGNTSITMSGGKVKTIYGGGYASGTSNGAVFGSTYVIINDGEIVENLYGGGATSSVSENTNITINGGSIGGDVFGGGVSRTFEGTATIKYLGGSINGDIIAGTGGNSIFGYDGVATNSKALIFISDKVNFTGDVYKEDIADSFKLPQAVTVVIENTFTKVGDKSADTPLLNASYKNALDDNYYLVSSQIITDTNVLRLQEFTPYGQDSGSVVHWALVGDVDLSEHTDIQNQISFAPNQELYIYGLDSLNATTFVATAINANGYIITEKADITNPSYELSSVNDIENRIYRGDLDAELIVGGGNTYAQNEANVNDINATVPSEMPVLDFLGTKIEQTPTWANWGSIGANDAEHTELSDVAIKPSTAEVGDTTYTATASYKHKFDSVSLFVDMPMEPQRLAPNYYINSKAYISGETDVYVVEVPPNLITVEFKKEANENSETIHSVNLLPNSTVPEPNEAEIDEITEPDFWTTTPNDASTKWEFSTATVPSEGTELVILYPYYKPTPSVPRPDPSPTVTEWTITFEDEDFTDNKFYDEVVVEEGTSVGEPSSPTSEDPNKEFVGWYEDEDLTIPYDFDDTVTGDITLYPKFEDKDSVTVTYEKDKENSDETETGKITGIVPGTDIVIDNNGGTNEGFDGDVTITENTTIPNPTKPGNIFTGYEESTDPETGETILTATWKPDTVDVTYNKDVEGTDDTEKDTILDLEVGTNITVDNAGGTNEGFDGDVTITEDTIIPNPTKPDNIFTGYDKVVDETTGEITLTATWKPGITVDVTYSENLADSDDTSPNTIVDLAEGTVITVDNAGGTNPNFDGSVTITVDTTIEDPTREGYIFTGYDKTVDPQTGEITLSATWKAIESVPAITVSPTITEEPEREDTTLPTIVIVPTGATVTPDGLIIDENGIPLGWLPIPEGYTADEITFDLDGTPIPLGTVVPQTSDVNYFTFNLLCGLVLLALAITMSFKKREQ